MNTTAGIVVKGNWTDRLKKDNVFVQTELKDLAALTGLKTKNSKSKAIVVEGQIVNVVSNEYGLLDNADYFVEVERKLVDADIQYVTRSINRNNGSFAVDYILQDDRYHVNVKNGKDKIMPMLRFTNSYDGSTPSTGNFGFFREVCSNGLHVAETKIGFRVRHRENVCEIVMPNIGDMVQKFLNNEYYSLNRKFEVLAEKRITNLNEFVKYTCTKMNLFKFEQSEKNPTEPSANAKIIIDTITKEAAELGTEPTLWLGYNAFNEYMHNGKKNFTKQSEMDSKVFATVLELAN